MTTNNSVTPRILVHGGAGEWKTKDHNLTMEAIRKATTIGWKILSGGDSALDAVEKVVMYLEDNPLFDAGVGSYLNDKGEVEMDALIADGSTQNFGAVAAVKHVRHPVLLARLVMSETNNCFFVGDGADQLAAEFGIPLIPNLELVTDLELSSFKRKRNDAEKLGTVGAVALDKAGRLAAATSTGGMPYKKKGRVGDSPIFGAGGYADAFGASSGTGRGEDMMRLLLCKYVVDQAAGGLDAQDAADAAMAYYRARIPKPEGGLIIIDQYGGLGAAHITAFMPVGWADADGNIQVVMKPGDRKSW